MVTPQDNLFIHSLIEHSQDIQINISIRCDTLHVHDITFTDRCPNRIRCKIYSASVKRY